MRRVECDEIQDVGTIILHGDTLLTTLDLLDDRLEDHGLEAVVTVTKTGRVWGLRIEERQTEAGKKTWFCTSVSFDRMAGEGRYYGKVEADTSEQALRIFAGVDADCEAGHLDTDDPDEAWENLKEHRYDDMAFKDRWGYTTYEEGDAAVGLTKGEALLALIEARRDLHSETGVNAWK